ncbi:MAG: hypothetical protein KGI50_00125 [Patescibacteria group bacterium]|nr:hypothetical protein [Patescibacteria group bacterium]MDE2438232.1 hypothetical protein [Patescibacteria group bacterium]
MDEQKSPELNGILHAFFETGCEGLMWTLIEDGKRGYNGLHFIEEGDKLIIYREDSSIIFEGTIMPDHKIGYAEYPGYPGRGQPAALGCWIHWTQQGWQPDDWATLFMQDEGKPSLRATLIKKSKKTP